MRVRKEFIRLEGVKSPKLIVIAAEGRMTENIYFEAMKVSLCASRVQLEILHREENASSPDNVYSQIKAFKDEYKIKEDDELWIVVDKDRWEDKMLSEVAQSCASDNNLHFCLSNPCFELWLLLHLEDISTYSEEQMTKLKANKKAKKNGDTWLKRRMRSLMGQYSESKYDANKLLPNVEEAIGRAKQLDKKPKDRWPQKVGTRVYLLAESIMDKGREVDRKGLALKI